MKNINMEYSLDILFQQIYPGNSYKGVFLQNFYF